MRQLQENLSASQRQDYEAHGYFYVIGGKTGCRYRIRHGHMLNVEQLGPKGQRVARLCFLPKGDLPAGDVLLAQKLALELFETEALRVAVVCRLTRECGPLSSDRTCNLTRRGWPSRVAWEDGMGVIATGQEAELRRRLHLLGYELRRSPVQDAKHPAYGGYMIVDTQ